MHAFEGGQRRQYNAFRVPGVLTAQLAQLAHLEWNSIFVDTIDYK